MRQLGMILWIGGAALAAYAMFVFDPSVEAGFGGGRVVNMGLQQQQMMMMVAGAALFIAGVVLHSLAITRGVTVDGSPKSLWQAYKEEVAKRDPNQAVTSDAIERAQQLGIRVKGDQVIYDRVPYSTLSEALAVADAARATRDEALQSAQDRARVPR